MLSPSLLASSCLGTWTNCNCLQLMSFSASTKNKLHNIRFKLLLTQVYDARNTKVVNIVMIWYKITSNCLIQLKELGEPQKISCHTNRDIYSNIQLNNVLRVSYETDEKWKDIKKVFDEELRLFVKNLNHKFSHLSPQWRKNK